MSNSRLEKFIYAICGMDVDDLPTPLSRIETLWNCLITGEMPDFEPLSRNEKYLMVMLNGDIDGLPEPTSRSEKLLYKIATGEADLTDVPGYLSRYEELLKQLIESGGIGGTDFEYVLYTLNDSFSTLYSTAEAPVKSAILSGNTLVNISKFESNIERTSTGNSQTIYSNDVTMLKTSTTYTFIYWIESTNGTSVSNITTLDGSDTQMFDRKILQSNGNLESNFILKFSQTSRDFTGHYGLKFSALNGSVKLVKSVILEGDYTNVDIPYFTGMQSVKMPVLTTTGKNLFHGIMTSGQLLSNNVIQINQTKMGYSEFLPVNEELDIYCSFYTNSVYIIEKIYFYDENKNQISMNTRPGKVTTPKGTKYFRISVTTADWNSAVVFDDIKDDFNIQVETGVQATSYEPYKTNILTATSKNLFDMNRPYDVITDSQATVTQNPDEITVSSAESGIYVNANFILDKDFFAGKTVTGSCLYESDEKDIGTVQIVYQDGDGEYHYQWIRTPRTFTFPNSFIGDVMLSVSTNNTGTPQSNTVTVKNIQLELGSTATPYEPYSEVTLRGIGEVKDTLDCLTGEVTKRIGEIVLDGSENWVNSDNSLTNTHRFSIALPDFKSSGLLFNDGGFKNITSGTSSDDTKNIQMSGTSLYLRIDRSVADDVFALKDYLSKNNLTVYGELTENSIKAVDLSTLDQDGQPTKLSTFNDTTHVSIEAEDLLPTVDLEVATKIEETLSSLPTLMNDISEKQQSLNEKIDEQAENINEVSTAMIEIRNDIL